MREQEMAKRYTYELMGSVLIYACILVPAIAFGRGMEPGLARVLVLTSPMLGFGLMGWAILRHFHRLDEFIRRMFLENTAIAAAVTAALTFTYGFLETAGYPRLSMFAVWVVMGATWGLVAMFRNATGR
jgi:hypothetical protein